MTIIDSIIVTSAVLLVISLTTYFMALLVIIAGIFVKHRWIDDIGSYLTSIYLTAGCIFAVLIVLWGLINLF